MESRVLQPGRFDWFCLSVSFPAPSPNNSSYALVFCPELLFQFLPSLPQQRLTPSIPSPVHNMISVSIYIYFIELEVETHFSGIYYRSAYSRRRNMAEVHIFTPKRSVSTLKKKWTLSFKIQWTHPRHERDIIISNRS